MTYLRQLFLLLSVVFVSYANATTYYVDFDNGDDSWNGKFDTYSSGLNGPKKSIGAALSIISDLDIVQITGGAYNECITISKSLTIVLIDNISVRCITMNGVGKKATLLGGRDLVILDSLSLRNGIIDASGTNSNVVIGQSGKVTGGSKSSFVENKLFKISTATTAINLFYPVGVGLDYRPVFVSLNQSTSSQNRYAVQVYAVPLAATGIPANIKNISKVHYWNLRHTGSAVPSKYSLKVFYDSAKNDDEVLDPQNLRLVIFHTSIGKYINLGGKGSGKYFGSITADNTTDTSGNFTLANIVGGTNTLGRREPVAKFSFSGKCVGAPVQFTDSNYTHKSSITRYQWDFGAPGNADTSNIKNPKYTYAATGPFTVRLIITNSLGFKDTFTRTVLLRTAPTSFFPNGDGCFGKPLSFNDQSSVTAPDTISNRRWEMGDGGIRTVKNFTYSYGLPGKYTVKLITVSSSGCRDTLSKEITVNAKPSPNFNAANICLGESTRLDGTGGVAGDTIITWKWFADNVFEGTGKRLNKFFTSAKTWQITLAVESQSGCFDTIKKGIIIYQPPKASFYLDPSIGGNDSIQCFKNNSFTLKNASQAFQGQLLTPTYYWGFPYASGTNSYASTLNGVVRAKMVIVSDKGCRDSVNRQYFVREPIVVKYGVATYCLPAPAEFSDSSTAGSASIVSQNWKFGDGNSGTGSYTTHAYTSGGNYTSRLIITTNEGCKDSLDKVVQITGRPTISFNAAGSNPFCVGDSLLLSVVGGSYIRWADNDTFRNRHFKTSGWKKATAYTSPFCFISDSFNISVYPAVFANAGVDTSLIRGRYILLKADGGLSYSWTPRNLVESPDSVRTRVRPQATTRYYVKVTDANGCSGVDSVLVRVLEPLFIRIPNLITPNGDGKNDAWDLREVPNIEIGHVSIFSLTGELVYDLPSGYNHTWTGTYNSGAPLPVGNYLYIIEVPTEKEPFRGFLQIAD